MNKFRDILIAVVILGFALGFWLVMIGAVGQAMVRLGA